MKGKEAGPGEVRENVDELFFYSLGKPEFSYFCNNEIHCFEHFINVFEIVPKSFISFILNRFY